MHTYLYIFLTGLTLLLSARPASAYSVLTHQAIIDAVWKAELRPLLSKQYPKASEAELQKAKAYAYGGSIVQDMGYFPFGNTFFTNLTHYVRSGDFVHSLINNSENMNDFAFALGAMAHYNADIYGHSIGTNKAVSLVYPELKLEYGNSVTYAEDPVAHVKTEFGFDVLQVARGNYADDAYQSFIGFEVSQHVLERAFLETYGLELGDVLPNIKLAIGTYRYTIKNIFPELTRAAWQAKKGDIQKSKSGATRNKFMYRMSRASYHEAWGKDYERPGFFERALAYIIRILPKFGPTRTLGFKMPTPEAEELFYKSFNKTVDNYSMMLDRLRLDKAEFKNMQLDTGLPTNPNEYELADETYAELVQELEEEKFLHITPALKQNILNFYKKMPPAKPDQEKNLKELVQALQALTAAKAED